MSWLTEPSLSAPDGPDSIRLKTPSSRPKTYRPRWWRHTRRKSVWFEVAAEVTPLRSLVVVAAEVTPLRSLVVVVAAEITPLLSPDGCPLRSWRRYLRKFPALASLRRSAQHPELGLRHPPTRGGLPGTWARPGVPPPRSQQRSSQWERGRRRIRSFKKLSFLTRSRRGRRGLSGGIYRAPTER